MLCKRVTAGIGTKALVLERKLRDTLNIDLLDIWHKENNGNRKIMLRLGVWLTKTLIVNPLIVINK